MGTPYKECPDCGAHLDAGEPCDCKENERAAAEPRKPLRLIAVCREVDRDTGRIAVYPLNMEINEQTLSCLKMRAQLNPELRYFTITSARWDLFGEAIKGILARRTVTRADVDRIGGIVEL